MAVTKSPVVVYKRLVEMTDLFFVGFLQQLISHGVHMRQLVLGIIWLLIG